MENGWTTTPPTEDGHYWFFGYLWGKPRPILGDWPKPPRLEQVQVRRVSNGVIYIGANEFLDVKGAIGYYVPMVMPVLPDEKQMEIFR